MAIARKLLVFGVTLAGVAALLLLGAVLFNGTVSAFSSSRSAAGPDPAQANADRLFQQGRDVFRFETFGDQAVWGGVLGLHKALAGAKNGGVRPGINPKQALALGLQVDAAAIPPTVAAA